MRKPPCKKDGVPCSKRCPGCQDHCPEMADWKAEKAAENEKKRQVKDIDNAVWDGKERLLSESCLQPGGLHRSRKLSQRARQNKYPLKKKH